ncbi:S8 family serine peptidase [Bdellovibrio svalbardensis]|uniref:S8 family serine peptidase n=1 Tax=Bdellovibrio svalbardensis TaxID=2972972 RepID=A0ABT6DH86_9BACT|nr:S8 family serine peptidase [Bdellovibrio svalbardensis]MDG0816221.1 S8 family serine peptidase [Bdellovibrio svalbardensis]
MGHGFNRRFLTFVIVFFAFLSCAEAGTSLKLNFTTINTLNSSTMMDASVDLSANLDSTVREYIVQYTRPIRPADRVALNHQFKVFGYLPDDALVVRGTFPQLLKFKASHSAVRTILKYEARFKVSSQLSALSVFNKDELADLVVRIFDANEIQKIAQAIQILNPQVIFQDISEKHLMLVTSKGFIPQIAELPGVEHVAPVPEMKLFDFNPTDSVSLGIDEYANLTGYESGTKIMKFEAAWAQGYAGRNQVLAMADTGVDSGDLANLVPDLSGAVSSGFAFGLRSTSWADPMGHGTHVAGLMVGRGTASRGQLLGGAHEAELVVGSMWSPLVRNMTVPSRLSVLFDHAFQAGARVHSNSWGSNKDPGAYDDSAVQVDEWVFNNPDLLVVFAAGNSGADLNKDGRIDAMSLGTPGTAKNCLTVGASKNRISQGGVQGAIGKLRDGQALWPSEPLFSSGMSDTETGLAPFSSRGPTKDGRIKPDVVAPGTNILGTKSHQGGASSLWGFFNKDYTWSGGTSMAAPLAAGAAGVARQILVEKWGVESPSAALVKATLIHSAEDLFPGQFGLVGEAQGQELLTLRPNSDEGYGRVNMENLVQWSAEDTKVIDNREGVAQDQAVSYSFTLEECANTSACSRSLYANLVWTDAPGSVNAAVALVNDLDLELTFPDGRVLRSEDHVNNLEKIEVSGLLPGTYQLTIKGHRVPQAPRGGQAFALIYTIFRH